MGIISKDKNVIKIFYNSTSINDDEAKACFSASDKAILTIDTAQNKVTPTQWSEILQGLGKNPIDLIDQNHAVIKDENILTNNSFSMDNWLTIFTKNPEIIMGVVAIVGEDYKHFKSPKSVIAFIADDADSTNISKK